MAITHPLNPPTTQLPPIAKIKSLSLKDIGDAIGYLRLLYNPAVRGTRRIDQKVVFTASRTTTGPTEAFNEALEPPVRQVSTSTSDLSLAALRSDEFEMSYAIRWLTAFVARADMLGARVDRAYDLEDYSMDADDLAWEQIIQDAAALLAVCAGTASAGLVSRAFAFRHKAGREVKVQITDIPLENQDYSSVGAQTWGSACLLAEMIVHTPADFGLVASGRSNGPMRVLELGAGTGLVSLAIGGLLREVVCGERMDHCAASVIATDFHPSVLENLRQNIAFNTASWFDPSSVEVVAHHLDWSNLPAPSSPPPFDQPFDLIFGADIIYEVEHARWIRSCVERFLRKPSLSPNECQPGANLPRFHLMIPLRPTHTAEAKSVEEVFPFAPDGIPSVTPSLMIVSKEVLLCEVEGGLRSRVGEGNMVEYAHYTIAWV
ncbi:putative methyltransferase-domain-containing protein [Cristinia sonorae]|uniref:Methyltransferase-domain-containing protein n=1 Tax=Cristinia sonorae TaxID=1940300 RepID=A0A8K0UDI3_9AGAR|nr:putative methyltransferase-domain-containing protein [Cristinia sonorae]